MSSTYVSNYYAAALRRTSGYAYVMFYETCESNVDPRTPRWCAQYAGSLQHVLSEIVEYVDCCDGGLTKGARGRPIRAETFLRRSEQALLAADVVTSRVTLEFSQTLATIPLDDLQAFDAAAERASITIHFTRDGEQYGSKYAMRTVDLGDRATADMLLDFMHAANVPVWRIFNMRDMARLPVPESGCWTPACATATELSQATSEARNHLAGHRLVKIRCRWPGTDYVREEHLVLDAQQRVLTADPMRWFCQDFLHDGRLTKLGQSLAGLKAFRTWMDAPTLAVDASECEVEAIATGSFEERAAEIAEALTAGRSRSLPARGPASAVFDYLVGHSGAAVFNVVTPAMGSPSNPGLF